MENWAIGATAAAELGPKDTFEQRALTSLLGGEARSETAACAVEGPTSTGNGATRRVEPGDAVGLGGGENSDGVDDFADDCGPRPADAFAANVIAG